MLGGVPGMANAPLSTLDPAKAMVSVDGSVAPGRGKVAWPFWSVVIVVRLPVLVSTYTVADGIGPLTSCRFTSSTPELVVALSHEAVLVARQALASRE